MNLLYNSTIAGLWTSFCTHFPFCLTARVTVEHPLVAGIVDNKCTNLLSFHVQAVSLPFCLNTHCPLFMDSISLSFMFMISPGKAFLPARTVLHARVFSFAKSRNSAGLEYQLSTKKIVSLSLKSLQQLHDNMVSHHFLRIMTSLASVHKQIPDVST